MNNLSKRIITSFFLLIVFLSCLFINKFTWLFLLIIVSIISFFEIIKIFKKIFIKNFILYIVNFFALLYLAFFILSGYSLLEIGSKIFVLFIVSVCICSDVGGYIVGKSIGGKKLTKISPKKTISGSLGSLIFSLFPLGALFFIKIENNVNFEYVSIISCLFISIFCQIGDLFISYFKRLSKVKDTGNILPGHGGILDRIDGIIFVVPLLYLISFVIK
tara:strand:+ start:662 stop:1315 length:654 start_codon:yes stop_codon:yes gene_type:complete